jgi:HD superfamily phosphohydrolase
VYASWSVLNIFSKLCENGPCPKYTDHEAYTQAIITGDTEVNAVLRKVSPEFPREVAEVTI